MTALPIIEHLDVLEDVLCRFFTGRVVPMVHELALECPEEAFDTGVVPAVPLRLTCWRSCRAREQLLVARGGILAAPIRVVQEPGRGGAVRQRHREGLLGQIHRSAGGPCAQPITSARVEIEDHRQIEPALRGPDIGDVPGPHPVGLRRP